MSSGLVPDFSGWLEVAWGSGQEFSFGGFFGINNLYFGQNSPYYLDDFLDAYPRFFGMSALVSGASIVAGSNVITVPSGSAAANGLRLKQFLQSAGMPSGTVITSLGDTTITVNNQATSTQSGLTLQVYVAAPIPITVIQSYINLAASSLSEYRWDAQWTIAMSLFVAHYCQLYAKSDEVEVSQVMQNMIHGETAVGTVPGSVFTISTTPVSGLLNLTLNGVFLTPGVDYTIAGNVITMTVPVSAGGIPPYAAWLTQTQVSQPSTGTASIAARGIAGGIQTSKSVGDVSVSYQALTSLEDWGAWNLTSYGQILATMAKVIGNRPMLIW